MWDDEYTELQRERAILENTKKGLLRKLHNQERTKAELTNLLLNHQRTTLGLCYIYYMIKNLKANEIRYAEIFAAAFAKLFLK